ncbi:MULTISPECIES: hypothetical protein [unclassified Streptomyces]|uniref:hypothetical protein n=1 Tax=unclassified Streptomyces TaxID=2593676 RepID=UPI000B5025B6|nr:MULTISPECIES: hypothetical protein [unclassified Streptomyces]MYW99911.1 hypothetical protein [Streptomyces sp. SID8378]SNB89877.1 hypothetical protein SAMN02745831_06171 [Streptomyces sp. PgraA7]
MTLTQPEPTASKKTDTDTLLTLCQAAIAKRHEEIRKQDREDDEQAVRHARTAAQVVFGEDAANSLGTWLPSPDMPENTYQAFVELVPNTSLIYTVRRTAGFGAFEVLAHCGRCSQQMTTRIKTLPELAGALHKAGVR